MNTALQPNAPHAVDGSRFSEQDFTRVDESDDNVFYEKDRFVQHLDAVALSTVEEIITRLIVEKDPAILDLMAGWDSHIAESLHSSAVVGLGLNKNELARNKILSQVVVHDLNREPQLPFPDSCFDAVLNTVSVDYMTRPVEVFREVGRILKPGGLFLVIFSNRMFPQKVTQIWRQSSERERLLLVEDFFRYAELFETPKVFVSKGKPRPKEDKYAPLGIPSDPVYAVYADKKGPPAAKKSRPELTTCCSNPLSAEAFEDNMKHIKHTLSCPYCGERMKKWAVPNTPFTTWENEYMYICFNDACSYLVKGWEVMNRQGNPGISYRLMYDPLRDRTMPVPVPSLAALKDGIVD